MYSAVWCDFNLYRVCTGSDERTEQARPDPLLPLRDASDHPTRTTPAPQNLLSQPLSCWSCQKARAASSTSVTGHGPQRFARLLERRSMTKVLLPAAAHEDGQRPRAVPRNRRPQPRVDHRQSHLHGGHAKEGELACHHLPQKNAKRKDVGLLRVGAVGEHLRSHVLSGRSEKNSVRERGAVRPFTDQPSDARESRKACTNTSDTTMASVIQKDKTQSTAI